MYFDEAIHLVNSGRKLTRTCWNNSYIYKDMRRNSKYYKQIVFSHKEKIEGIDIKTIMPYIPSNSDLKAEDWEEYTKWD